MRSFFATIALSTAVTAVRAQCPASTLKLLNEHRIDEARTEAQALLRRNPNDDAAMHCMGTVAMESDKPGDAIDWFEKAVKADDRSSIHHLWLGNALGQQAEHTNKLKLPFLARRIKSEFDRAAELDPTSVEARHGLIQFYSQAPGVMGGSMDKAKEQAVEITKLNAMRGHIEMGVLLERDKDVAGAEREYLAAVSAARPDSLAGLNTLASFYRRQKRYADAVAQYDRMLKEKPDAINARLNIAWSLVQSGQGFDRAEREVKEWLASPPKDAPPQNSSFAHYVLGQLYEHQAKRDAARAEYQTAVSLNSRNEDAKKALAALK